MLYLATVAGGLSAMVHSTAEAAAADCDRLQGRVKAARWECARLQLERDVDGVVSEPTSLNDIDMF